MSVPGSAKERLVSFALALLFVVGMSCLTTLAAYAQTPTPPAQTAATPNPAPASPPANAAPNPAPAANAAATATDNKKDDKTKAPCPGDCIPCRAGQSWFQYFIFILMTLVLLVLVKLIFSRLAASNWDLGEALSEEADLSRQANANANAPNQPAAAAIAAGGAAQVAGAAAGVVAMTGKPVLVASTSRLIALVGMLVLIVYFIALAYYTVWALLNCTKMSAAEDVKLVLYAGAALFAPYAVNKFADVFKFK